MMQLVYIEEPMGHIYITHDLRDKGNRPRPIRTPRPILILLNTAPQMQSVCNNIAFEEV